MAVSKDKAPAIHFVIHHPRLCAAIGNMVFPVVEEEGPASLEPDVQSGPVERKQAKGNGEHE